MASVWAPCPIDQPRLTPAVRLQTRLTDFCFFNFVSSSTHPSLLSTILAVYGATNSFSSRPASQPCSRRRVPAQNPLSLALCRYPAGSGAYLGNSRSPPTPLPVAIYDEVEGVSASIRQTRPNQTRRQSRSSRERPPSPAATRTYARQQPSAALSGPQQYPFPVTHPPIQSSQCPPRPTALLQISPEAEFSLPEPIAVTVIVPPLISLNPSSCSSDELDKSAVGSIGARLRKDAPDPEAECPGCI